MILTNWFLLNLIDYYIYFLFLHSHNCWFKSIISKTLNLYLSTNIKLDFY